MSTSLLTKALVQTKYDIFDNTVIHTAPTTPTNDCHPRTRLPILD